MATKQPRLLPVGIQTFEKIIKGGYLYVDKTAYIQKMLRAGSYIFLSRPRRFGKSLLVSTLQSFFEGKKELFKGLDIDKPETEWTEYPVLRFSLAAGKHLDKAQLERYLLYILAENERRFGLASDKIDPNIRLCELIRHLAETTGRQVVVLIDEYDAPLLDVVHEDTQLPMLRQAMRNFYSPLKDCDPYLKFVFITGITKFSQLSIFSELNNLKNISMNPDFAAVCGITTDEMQTQMAEELDGFAKALATSRSEAVRRLEELYDGYHFTWPSAGILNPFSLLNALQDGRLDNYWFASGTPTYLVEMLRKFDVRPADIGAMDALAEEFDTPTEDMHSIIPLLYQSGYLTIKKWEKDSRLFTLDIPNTEVRTGLMNSLLPLYVQRLSGRGMTMVAKMSVLLKREDLDGALKLLQAFLLTVPYCENASSEGHYQQMLYIIFSLLAQYDSIDIEVRTPTGRVDMVMRTDKRLYLFELKLNRSSETAMEQIDLKDYPARFALCRLPIVKVGINFNLQSRTIDDWRIVT